MCHMKASWFIYPICPDQIWCICPEFKDWQIGWHLCFSMGTCQAPCMHVTSTDVHTPIFNTKTCDKDDHTHDQDANSSAYIHMTLWQQECCTMIYPDLIHKLPISSHALYITRKSNRGPATCTYMQSDPFHPPQHPRRYNTSVENCAPGKRTI